MLRNPSTSGSAAQEVADAAQAVEVSAYPDRYNNYEPVAATILTTLIGSGGPAAATDPYLVTAGQVTESSRVVFPLPEGTWVVTSEFGHRSDPFTGETSYHSGLDLGAADGTPILAAADGTVTVAEFSGGYGGLIIIEHTINGQSVATAYAHMWQHGIHVKAGDQVRAGQHIGDVGSSGYSTGAHLHFEVRQGGTNGDFVDPAAWLNSHDAADLPEPETGPGTPGEDCDPENGSAPGGSPEPFEGDPNRMVDDPTSDGQITARMLHLYEQTLAQSPDIGWGCYSPRPGTTSRRLVVLPTTSGWPEPTNRLTELSSCATTVTPT